MKIKSYNLLKEDLVGSLIASDQKGSDIAKSFSKIGASNILPSSEKGGRDKGIFTDANYMEVELINPITKDYYKGRFSFYYSVTSITFFPENENYGFLITFLGGFKDVDIQLDKTYPVEVHKIPKDVSKISPKEKVKTNYKQIKFIDVKKAQES